MDNEDFEEVGGSQSSQSSSVDNRNFAQKSADRAQGAASTVENVGKTVKNTGKTVENVGKATENTAKTVKNTAKTIDTAGKVAENVGKAADASGKTVSTAGKVGKAVGTGVDATGTVANVSGDLITAIPYVGWVLGPIISTAGLGTSILGKATNALGTGTDAAGQGLQAAGKSAQVAGKGSQGAAKGMESAANAAEKAGQRMQSAGKKISKIGEGIEERGKELKKIAGTVKGAVDITVNFGFYAVLVSLIVVFIVAFSFYSVSYAPISETLQEFSNYLNGQDMSYPNSSLYTGLDDEGNSEAIYKELSRIYNKNNGSVDFPLLISTVFYIEFENNNETNYSKIPADKVARKIKKEIKKEYSKESKYTRGKLLRIRLLANEMLEIANVEDDEDDDIEDDIEEVEYDLEDFDSFEYEEKYKQFLADYYLRKMPEYKSLLFGLTKKEKQNKIDELIENIYEKKRWYEGIFQNLEQTASSEEYGTTCNGGIASELANSDLVRIPIDAPSNYQFKFDGDYAFGIRDGVNHNGIDINKATAGVGNGDPVYAIADGEVITSEPNVSCNTRTDKSCKRTAGAWVRIKHSIMINGKIYNFISVYMHLQTKSGQPKVGTKVSKGDIIGKIGNTGDSSGPHLHFEFRDGDNPSTAQPVDPINLFIKCLPGELVGADNEEKIWWYLLDSGTTKQGAAGVLGNWMQESGLRTNNLQNSYEKSLGMSDEQYTAAVNNGTYSKNSFVNDSAGYGLAQWTFYSRKKGLYEYKLKMNSGIDDLQTQLGFYTEEATPNKKLMDILSTTTDIDSAVTYFQKYYESAGVPRMENRYSYAKQIYDRNKSKTKPSSQTNYNLNKSIANFTSQNIIITKASELKNYIVSNNYKYGSLDVHINEIKNSKTIDSMSYVSWVLYESGYDSFGGKSNSLQMFLDNPWNFELIDPSYIQPGDIIIYKDSSRSHIEIYAGDNKVFSISSNNDISIDGVSNISWPINSATKILRPKK